MANVDLILIKHTLEDYRNSINRIAKDPKNEFLFANLRVASEELTLAIQEINMKLKLPT